MTIILTGGGTGGHITPLLAVAHELKQIDPTIRLIGVCETNAKFVSLFHDDPTIDEVRQVPAGKFRRYSGQSLVDKLLDIKTLGLNVRDTARVIKGYRQARKLLIKIQPDGVFIKGGFVGVPIGLAAARLKIPIITHDSDSSPGLANRIVARWTSKHATGMPGDQYNYPAEKTVFTGIPIAKEYVRVTEAERIKYREALGLKGCEQVVAIIGGSQGAEQLNKDTARIAGRLLHDIPSLGIIHIVGESHEKAMTHRYKQELLADELPKVVVRGFVSDLHRYSAAADIVITRAGANSTAEFAVQGVPIILVPGRLAGAHQNKNADVLTARGAAITVAYGDPEGLYDAISMLLRDPIKRTELSIELMKISKPHAARELANLIVTTFDGRAV